MNGETTFNIVDQTEVFTGLFNGDDIYKQKSNTKSIKQILCSFYKQSSTNLPMKPAGKVGSVRTLPSTLIKRCITILVTSAPFKAYFKRFLKKIIKGKDSRNLCGPVEGRGAKTPPNLSNIQALGAAKRFKCFLGPRAYFIVHKHYKIREKIYKLVS